jgi:hypothetical protein
VTPKSVSLNLPGSGHSEATVRKLVEAAESQVVALGADLEVAWQVCVCVCVCMCVCVCVCVCTTPTAPTVPQVGHPWR